MTRQNYKQRLIKLARSKGILRPNHLKNEGIPRYMMSRLVAQGFLTKLGRGLYSSPDAKITEHQTLVEITIIKPQCVICLLSALSFHGITTQMPHQVWICLPYNSRVPKIDYPPFHVVRMKKAGYLAGTEHYQIQGSNVKIYDLNKTIVDCFKFRRLVGIDVCIEALSIAHRQKKLNLNKITEYAQIQRILTVIRPYLETIIEQ